MLSRLDKREISTASYGPREARLHCGNCALSIKCLKQSPGHASLSAFLQPREWRLDFDGLGLERVYSFKLLLFFVSLLSEMPDKKQLRGSGLGFWLTVCHGRDVVAGI